MSNTHRIISVKALRERFKKDLDFYDAMYRSECTIEPFTARIEFDGHQQRPYYGFTEMKHVAGYIYDICFTDMTNRQIDGMTLYVILSSLAFFVP